MKKHKGFTIIEVIIVILLITLGVLVVLNVFKNSNKYLQKTRQKIIATNLAREGIEQVINIRDTNWKKRAGKKDQTRLKLNPIIDNGSDGAENDLRFNSGNYIIQKEINNNQEYFLGTKINENFDINNGLSASNIQFSICESGGKRNACPGIKPIMNEGGYYFRIIKGIGLYQKDTNTEGGEYLNCNNGLNNCGDNSAKEYRFCSIVEYLGENIGKAELCTVITNFKK